jgi:hypothetical protein
VFGGPGHRGRAPEGVRSRTSSDRKRTPSRGWPEPRPRRSEAVPSTHMLGVPRTARLHAGAAIAALLGVVLPGRLSDPELEAVAAQSVVEAQRHAPPLAGAFQTGTGGSGSRYSPGPASGSIGAHRHRPAGTDDRGRSWALKRSSWRWPKGRGREGYSSLSTSSRMVERAVSSAARWSGLRSARSRWGATRASCGGARGSDEAGGGHTGSALLEKGSGDRQKLSCHRWGEGVRDPGRSGMAQMRRVQGNRAGRSHGPVSAQRCYREG